MQPTLRITIEGTTYQTDPETSIQQLLERFLPERTEDALAVRTPQGIKGLRWRPKEDVEVSLLTYEHEEVRRMYERSARFLLLLAARDVLPGATIRFEHSAGYGIYTIVSGMKLTTALVNRLEARMRELVALDAPFEHTHWSRAQAIEYFTEQGQDDTVRLLAYRSKELFTVYTCLGMSEYLYGEMLPSTGFVHGFSLLFYMPGLVLQLPSPNDREKPAPFQRRPKLLRAFAQSAEWGRILGLENVADLNDAIRAGKLREIIRVSEALHEKSVAHIADNVVSRNARLVLVAGPSSSGKTTFTNRLAVQLRVNGQHPVIISLDNYYLNRDELPLEEDGQPDLETIESLDLPLFGQHLVQLLDGEEVEVPRFSFGEGKRKPQGVPLRLTPDQPLLIEGIHGLNPRLSEAVPIDMTYRVYISALTSLNLDNHNRIRTTDARLLRRLVRDRQFRKASPERTFAMWPSVREGEEKYIFPFQEQSDVMFNSSLPYELCLLKSYAMPLLEDVDPDGPYALQAGRLRKFLNYFLEGDALDEVPPTSLLREFIGESTFYMK